MAEWRQNPKTEQHTLFEVLVVNDDRFPRGRAVATIEAFSERGPFYANAVDPEGRHHRLGPGVTFEFAKKWAERIALGEAASTRDEPLGQTPGSRS